MARVQVSRLSPKPLTTAPLGAPWRPWDGHSRCLAPPFDAEDWSAERWDEEDYAAWTRSTCPAGRPQRAERCLGHRELVPHGLQLRVLLSGDEGVCDVSVEEDEDAVRVRVHVCYSVPRSKDGVDRAHRNCPVHLYLNEPLGDRTVIDLETGRAVPLFVPYW